MNDTIWIHYARPRTSWYELDEPQRAEHEAAWRSLDAAALDAGATTQGSFSVRGQSDYSTVQVWTFPSYDAVYDYWESKVEHGYAQWFDFANQVGKSLP